MSAARPHIASAGIGTGTRAGPVPGRPSLRSRVRILPLTILAVALLLGLKIGAFWQGRSELFVTPAGAQQPAAQPAGGQQATGQPMQVAPRPGQQPQGQQMAQAAAPPAAPAAAPAAAAPAAAAPAPATPAPATPAASAVKSLADRDPTTFTKAEIELLANLAQRREVLEQRSRELDLRESLLAATEKRIDERIAELKKLEGSIKQIVQQYDQQEEKNLQSLVKVYENMKSKDAARIFEKLDADVLLNVVERMKEAKVAAVLADMSPAVAQDLTVRLATRKQIPANLRAGADRGAGPAAAPPGQAPAPAPAQPATR
ncbi:MotE family protein [Ferrovibrio sp.]|uniref:MotE family protein n=1 Tax=Ferrovibrio sp. TaxID=1917215 RepID=UPI003512D4D4